MMKPHLNLHYGQNRDRKEHVDNYRGSGNAYSYTAVYDDNITGTPNVVPGLKDGNKCPVCSKRIVCLSHYVWHMENDHDERAMDVSLATHVRCLTCTQCFPLSCARNHFDIFCSFIVFEELRQG